MNLTAEEQKEFAGIVPNLNDEDSDKRRWAVYDLEKFPSEDILDYLLTAAQDEHRAVREASSEVLEGIDPSLSIRKLTPLLGHPKIEVRNLIAALISKFGDEVVEALLESMVDGNEDVRKFSADILGLIQSEEAVEGLAKAMYDPVENVGVSAAEALGKIHSAKALPHLQKIFEEYDYLKRETAEAMGLIGTPEGAHYLMDHLMDISDLLVEYAMIDAMGNAGDQPVLDFLVTSVDSLDPSLHAPAMLGVLKIASREKLQLFNRPDFPILELIGGLGEGLENYQQLLIELIDESVPEPVLRQLIQSNESLDSQLLVALIKVVANHASLHDFCLAMVDHSDDWVAYTAIEHLPQMGVETASLVIQKVLEGDRNLPQLAAMRAIQQMDIKQALDWVKPFLDSEDEDLRSLAGQVLGVS